jgi:hypothetical protein
LETIELEDIRLNSKTQSRAELDQAVVDDYAELLENGISLPPIDVFWDDKDHWIAGGWHRYWAHKKLGHKVVPCKVHKGGLREAVLFSCGDNAAHGLRRSAADKRKAVETLLKDREWSKYSNRKVAEVCHVSYEFVRRMRPEAHSTDNGCQLKPGSEDPKRIGKDGKSRKQPARPAQEECEEEGDVAVLDEPPAEREPGDDTDLIKADRERSRNNGREIVTAKERKEALRAFGVVVRFLDKLKRHESLFDCTNRIVAVLEGKE